MCGRFTQRTPARDLARAFVLAAVPDIGPRYNVAPTQDVLGVRLGDDGKREAALLQWGLIPSWAKEPKMPGNTINARGDSVATKPAFRAAFKRRRCLIVADGYFEWLRDGKVKRPFLHEIDGGKPFAFAGLWEPWGPPEQRLESCTIITTDANAVAEQIHDRMPVILHEADTTPGSLPRQHPEQLQSLLVPFGEPSRMSVREVSTVINNSRNEGPECIAEPMAG